MMQVSRIQKSRDFFWSLLRALTSDNMNSWKLQLGFYSFCKKCLRFHPFWPRPGLVKLLALSFEDTASISWFEFHLLSGPVGLVRFVWCGGFFLFALLVFVSLLDPSVDNSWIYLRYQAQGTMTATIVMMRAAMDQEKHVNKIKWCLTVMEPVRLNKHDLFWLDKLKHLMLEMQHEAQGLDW